MSQIEQSFRSFLNRYPDIRAAYARNLINIRALARFFIKEEHLPSANLEAIIAMIRRADIRPLASQINKDLFAEIKVSTKDGITILDYEKSKAIVEKSKDIVHNISYDKNETLKVAVGLHSLKIIVDATNSSMVKQQLGKTALKKEYGHISEISILFSQKALEEKGIVAFVTSQLLMEGINIREMITCTPELILYFDDKESLKAYEVIKNMKENK